MMDPPNNKSANPLGKKYAELVSAFLAEKTGEPISEELINQLGDLVASTEYEVIGITESSEILGTSRQRASQILETVPKAGKIMAGSFWLKESIELLALEREARRQKHMGIPYRRAEDN